MVIDATDAASANHAIVAASAERSTAVTDQNRNDAINSRRKNSSVTNTTEATPNKSAVCQSSNPQAQHTRAPTIAEEHGATEADGLQTGAHVGDAPLEHGEGVADESGRDRGGEHEPARDQTVDTEAVGTQ